MVSLRRRGLVAVTVSNIAVGPSHKSKYQKGGDCYDAEKEGREWQFDVRLGHGLGQNSSQNELLKFTFNSLASDLP